MKPSVLNKQLILLKLIHEYENFPDFREEIELAANSPEMKCLSRIKALMKKVSIAYGVNFSAAVASMNQQFLWDSGVRNSITYLQDAIEELKLDLELEGPEEIGMVYRQGSEFDFFRDLRSIIEKSSKEIFVVDPYFNGDAFSDLFSNFGNNLSIRLLSSGNFAEELIPYSKKHIKQFSSKVEIRKTKKIHDRAIFIDNVDRWVVGGSLKDGGKKPSYIMPLNPSLTSEKLSIYNDIWLNSVIAT